MNEGVFDQENENDEVFSDSSSQPMSEEDHNYLEDLVGEGKKFHDVQSLARGKYESDKFIESLQRETKELRDELKKRMAVEEVADKIYNLQRTDVSNAEPDEDSLQIGSDKNKPQSGFSKQEIEELLDKKMKERDNLTRAEKNLNEVSDTLRKKFGDKTTSYLQQKAQELGMSIQNLKNEAVKNPRVFYKLIDFDQVTQPTRTQSSATPPQNRVNTSSFTSGTQERNAAYYAKLYKENPKLRLDRNMAIQEHKDALRLGEKFYE